MLEQYPQILPIIILSGTILLCSLLKFSMKRDFPELRKIWFTAIKSYDILEIIYKLSTVLQILSAITIVGLCIWLNINCSKT